MNKPARLVPDAVQKGKLDLLARRLVEAGGRFVRVFPGLEPFLSPWSAMCSPSLR